MRTKTNYGKRPKSIEIMQSGDNAVIFFRENITALPEDEDGKVTYEAVEYSIQVPYTENLEDRVMNAQDNWREMALQKDYDEAAKEIRMKRNELLADSDKDLALDRMGLDVPSGTTFQAWLTFLRELGNAVTGDIAEYRQALRDIPQQEGFPYDVEWPTL